MSQNAERSFRKLIRLRQYDYSQSGLYFVTICTHQRLPLFGEIVDGIMNLNQVGNIVANSWCWLSYQYEYVLLYEYIVMPNHFHGILEIRRNDICRGRKPSLQKRSVV